MKIMEAADLLSLLDACVEDVDSDGIHDLLTQIQREWPEIVTSERDVDFDICVRLARLVAFSRDPQPAPFAMSILLDVSEQLVARGRPEEGVRIAERAVDNAEDQKLTQLLLHARNVHSAASCSAGFYANALQSAVTATTLARESGDRMAAAEGWVNVTATLFAMGCYRETISVALRAIRSFRHVAACSEFVGCLSGNLARAALATRHYALAAESAREACERLGLPRDIRGIVNRVSAERTWMQASIGLNDQPSAVARLEFIRGASPASPHAVLQVHRLLAEAAYEIYAGSSGIAIARLLDLLDRTQTMRDLYQDNLRLLVRAYERDGDHSQALLFLGTLVGLFAETQPGTVASLLGVINERQQTLYPGKEDVRSVLHSIVRATPGDKVIAAAMPVWKKSPEQEYRGAYERLAISAQEYRGAYERLAMSAENLDGRHVYRVGRLAGLLAAKLRFDTKFCDEVEKGARLHDIGKLGIPNGLLLKPVALTPAEWSVVKRHAAIGAQIIGQCSHPAFRIGEQIALCHHEEWDGGGYPNSLRGEDIPAPARIATLADVYDTLTHVRPYKRAWTHDEAVAFINEQAGSKFDPAYAARFVELVSDLHSIHGKRLDDFLAEAANSSTFVVARDRMEEVLARAKISRTLDQGKNRVSADHQQHRDVALVDYPFDVQFDSHPRGKVTGSTERGATLDIGTADTNGSISDQSSESNRLGRTSSTTKEFRQSRRWRMLGRVHAESLAINDPDVSPRSSNYSETEHESNSHLPMIDLMGLTDVSESDLRSAGISVPDFLKDRVSSDMAILNMRVQCPNDLGTLSTAVSRHKPPPISGGKVQFDESAEITHPQLSLYAVYPSGAFRTVGAVEIGSTGGAFLRVSNYWQLFDPDDNSVNLHAGAVLEAMCCVFAGGELYP